MNQRDNILTELQELSAVIAAVPRVNVFHAPEGYFTSFPGQVLLSVAQNERAGTGLQQQAVPQGYFDNLAGNILDRIRQESLNDVLSETRGTSVLLADIGNANVFSVPTGYFETLPSVLLHGVLNDASDESTFSEISTELSSIRHNNVFEVPQGYFDNLADSILKRVQGVAFETSEVSPLVAGIGNTNVFTSPEGYFSQLPSAINSRLTSEPAKVITMKSRFRAVRFAVAAVLTGLIGLSIFFMLNKSSVAVDEHTLTAMETGKAILKANSFDKELNSISEDDIINFLESKGDNVEAALVASLQDEKTLPDATDYLINDNTLDELLKSIDLKN